jgi:hypothetical protein
MKTPPYNLVPGTQIIHSTTDVYELSEEADGVSHIVKLQADNAGVYLESSKSEHEGNTKRITECLSIESKELAIVVAHRILELYDV